MNKKDGFLSELIQVLTAPTYYFYCLALVIIYLLQYLPALSGQSAPAAPDSAAGAAARVFADVMGAFLVFFPAFVVSTSTARDRKAEKLQHRKPREGMTAVEAVGLRTTVQLLTLFLPVLLLSVAAMCGADGTFMERMTFPKLAVFWLLPTLLCVTALSGLATELFGTVWTGIVILLPVWIITLGTTANVGDYDSCLAVRHAVFGAYGEYQANYEQLFLNR